MSLLLPSLCRICLLSRCRHTDYLLCHVHLSLGHQSFDEHWAGSTHFPIERLKTKLMQFEDRLPLMAQLAFLRWNDGSKSATVSTQGLGSEYSNIGCHIKALPNISVHLMRKCTIYRPHQNYPTSYSRTENVISTWKWLRGYKERRWMLQSERSKWRRWQLFNLIMIENDVSHSMAYEWDCASIEPNAVGFANIFTRSVVAFVSFPPQCPLSIGFRIACSPPSPTRAPYCYQTEYSKSILFIYHRVRSSMKLRFPF